MVKKWVNRIRNEEILEKKKKEHWSNVKKRRGQILGHSLRRGGLLKDILESELRKESGRGRPN